MSAMHYAIRDNNLAAIKTLASESKKVHKEARVEAPKCYLKTFGTGEYNYRYRMVEFCVTVGITFFVFML